uniref:Uncharacterized protein n=1 Tax=Micrurus spixii TaxID=129469 RepID=A0A2D4MLU5_9SAUR
MILAFTPPFFIIPVKESFIAIFTDFLEVPYQLPCNFEEADHHVLSMSVSFAVLKGTDCCMQAQQHLMHLVLPKGKQQHEKFFHSISQSHHVLQYQANKLHLLERGEP